MEKLKRFPKPKRPEIRLTNGTVHKLDFEFIKEHQDKVDPYTVSKWLQELKHYENLVRRAEMQGKTDDKQFDKKRFPDRDRTAIKQDIAQYEERAKEQHPGVMTRVKNFVGLGKKEKK